MSNFVGGMKITFAGLLIHPVFAKWRGIKGYAKFLSIRPVTVLSMCSRTEFSRIGHWEQLRMEPLPPSLPLQWKALFQCMVTYLQ